MGAYRREKVGKEPTKGVRGYRYVKVGLHRVLVALLPGGKSRAVKLLHPKHEKHGGKR